MNWGELCFPTTSLTSVLLDKGAHYAEYYFLRVRGQTVEQTNGQAFIAQDLDPLAKGQIGGDEEGHAFVECAAELKEQLGTRGREGHRAEFIENDELVAQGARQKLGEPVLVLGLMKVIDKFGNGIEAHAVVLATGGEAQRNGEMGFNSSIDMPP